MKRRLKCVALLLLLIFSFSSCKKPEVYFKQEAVLIVDACHEDAWVEVRSDGKNMRPIVHNEVNYVEVRSDDRSYLLEGKAWYDRYFDRIGDTVTARIKYTDYGKNWIFRDVVALEG